MRIAISIQTEYLDNPDQRFQRRKIYPTKIKSPRQLLVKRLKFEVNCRRIMASSRYWWSAPVDRGSPGLPSATRLVSSEARRGLVAHPVWGTPVPRAVRFRSDPTRARRPGVTGSQKMH